MRILESVISLSEDTRLKQAEVNTLRMKIDNEDQANLGERKEIEYLETMVKEKKKES